MGTRGPKPLSAKILQARGSQLASARAREELHRQGAVSRFLPVVHPLPRSLSKQAREWGTTLMAEAHYDATEYRLLVEMLALWDAIQALKKDVARHGVSTVDKNGLSHQRPDKPRHHFVYTSADASRPCSSL